MSQTKLISLIIILLSIAIGTYSNISKSTSDSSETCLTNKDTTCQETTSAESTDDTLNIIPPAEAPVNSLGVKFENLSGQKVKLWWDDNADGILQSEMSHTDEIIINTYIGHRFYFTPINDKSNILYKTIMTEHVGNVVLYDENEMKKRDMEFEIEKQLFYKNYYEKTGKRWLNYYPRKPVKHFYWNFTTIGDVIKVKSSQTFFNKCNIDEIDQEIRNTLIENENKWLETHEIHEINQIHPMNETDHTGEKKKGSFANVGGINPMPSYYEMTDKYHVIRWNQTFYCRNIADGEVDDLDRDELQVSNDLEFDIEVLCTEPQVARILNFVSDAEIDAIKNAGLYNGLKRSTVTEEAVISQDRTSATVWIDRSDSSVIDNVIRRIADVIKIPESKLHLNMSSESLQLVHYFRGELYKAHHDYGTDRPHNRYITFLIYLNDVENGGYTSFPQASKKCKDENGYFGVKPIKGSVAFFYDLLPDGNVDPLSLHYAEPPINCEKWMSNLWIWDEYFTH